MRSCKVRTNFVSYKLLVDYLGIDAPDSPVQHHLISSYHSINDGQQSSMRETIPRRYSVILPQILRVQLSKEGYVIPAFRNTEIPLDIISCRCTSIFEDAVCHEDVEIVKELLEASVNYDTPNPINGLTPLLFSTAFSSTAPNDKPTEIACLLVKYGADLSVKDSKGRTPLYLAAEIGNQILLRVIFAKNCSTSDVCAADGTTPLIKATQLGLDTIVHMLISAGANKSVTDPITGMSFKQLAKIKNVYP